MSVAFLEFLIGFLESIKTPLVVGAMIAIYHYQYHVKSSKR